MKFFIKDFFSKIDQIRKKLQIYDSEETHNGKLHFSAIGIRTKCNGNFILAFVITKARYYCKIFCQKIVISGSVSTIQRCIVNNISQNKQVWVKAWRH